MRIKSCSTRCRGTAYQTQDDTRATVAAVRARARLGCRDRRFDRLARRRSHLDRQPRRHAGVRARHSGRLHPVRADADRRCGVSSQDAAGCADRSRGDRALQARLHRLQDRAGTIRPRAAHAARVGDPGQSVPAADGLCDPVAALREQPHPRRDAGVPAGRMAWRAGAARHRVRAVELPRQHRGRADRRHDGAPRVPRPSPHRLSRGHRGCLQRRRLGQRGRRHHHHDDVDRRHQPAVGAQGLCRGRPPDS